jgi:uncharacterized protein (DUF2132 family)
MDQNKTKWERQNVNRMYVQKPKLSEASNLKSLNEMIMQATKTKEFSHQLIMGDFNFPKVNWKTWSNNVEYWVHSFP